MLKLVCCESSRRGWWLLQLFIISVTTLTPSSCSPSLHLSPSSNSSFQQLACVMCWDSFHCVLVFLFVYLFLLWNCKLHGIEEFCLLFMSPHCSPSSDHWSFVYIFYSLTFLYFTLDSFTPHLYSYWSSEMNTLLSILSNELLIPDSLTFISRNSIFLFYILYLYPYYVVFFYVLEDMERNYIAILKPLSSILSSLLFLRFLPLIDFSLK